MMDKKISKKVIRGKIVSDKMKKTVVVAVDTFKQHSKYLKRYVSTKKFKAHDPQEKFKIGDKVEIRETRPISKGKKWEVVY